jgi:histidine triad (HIT) family protein
MTDEEASCLFCRIARGEIPAQIIHQTPETIAFRDINPQAPYHALVVPRRHIASLNDLDDFPLAGRLAHVAAELARQEGFADNGYRVVINTNRDGGQTVGHLHLHLLAGRHMTWPPG